jgi:hypothetical protein
VDDGRPPEGAVGVEEVEEAPAVEDLGGELGDGADDLVDLERAGQLDADPVEREGQETSTAWKSTPAPAPDWSTRGEMTMSRSMGSGRPATVTVTGACSRRTIVWEVKTWWALVTQSGKSGKARLAGMPRGRAPTAMTLAGF